MVRNITEKDVPRLVAIEQMTQAAPWSEEIFKRCLTLGYDCWGIDRDDQLIAFIMMSSNVTGEHHILNLCVVPEHQRKGLGRELLIYALTQAKKNNAGIVY